MATHRFPDGFLWGAATSAYQIEGSPLADGAGMSIQHRFAHTPGNTRDGATGDVAADHYNRWREDITIMRELGLPAYQFSIAWPRVLPTGTGDVNKPGIDFYDRLVDGLLEAGIEPCPILHVWDLPGELQDQGGWANRDSADWFAEYAAIAFDRLGDRAANWLTICEPSSIVFGGYMAGVVPPAVKDIYAGLRAGHHILLAHGRAVQAFRASDASGKIGTSSTIKVAKPASSDPADVAAAERSTLYHTGLWLDPVMLGTYPEEITRLFGDAWPEVSDEDLATISQPIDFVGVTYYSRDVVAAERPAVDEVAAGNGNVESFVEERRQTMGRLMGVRVIPAVGQLTGIDWPIDAEGAYDALIWLRDRYGNPPIYMAESGAAFNDVVIDGKVADPERISFIRDYLAAAHRAIAEGVDLRAWFVWSFLDTYEFWLGYSARFGLVHIDYDSLARTVKDSGFWFRDVIAANGFELP